MLYEDKQLPELFYMKHRHDNKNDYVKYEDNILNNTLSPYNFNNEIMNSFLNRIKKLVSILFDQHNVIKNFKNFMVDKYYYKHNN